MEISATLKCKSKTRKSTLGCKACTQGKKYDLQGYMFAGTFVFHKSCWVSHTTESLCGLVTVCSFTFKFSSKFPWTDGQSQPEQCA